MTSDPATLTGPPARTCGSCTLCCKVMGVPEIQKPENAWCTHAKKSCGCSIYANRPSKCREFSCLWLLGLFGEPEHRPDKLHAVPVPTNDGKNLLLVEDPGYTGHARLTLRNVIRAIVKDKDHYVVVVCGDQRVFFGWQSKFDELQTQGMVHAESHDAP